MNHVPNDSTESDDLDGKVPAEALGDDEQVRPQPADEPITRVKPESLLNLMRQTVDRLESDRTSEGDLKILSRTLRELRYAFKVFRPYRRRRKVTIFGSARTPPDDPAYQTAEEFGRAMAKHGWMIITGAGRGIMEAGHVGAGRESSMGLNIVLPFEQRANDTIDGDAKLVTMRYFFTRKLMFVKECSAVVCLPGGFGTLDEALETLTLLQTGKQTMIPVVFLDPPGGTYYRELSKFIDRELLEGNMISAEDVRLYRVTDSVDEAVEEVLGFYRVFHSMRYVRHSLVMRLNSPLSEQTLAEVNERFNDILVEGEFIQRSALREERDEAELADLPRLVGHFDRRSLGRLRMLIDFINRPEAGEDPDDRDE
ncbi:LOG family protein [Candidatus Laterigemmans baculatus]|uniref:LOG family protein n=1 Tax=Candidatus Laterigemmans baculatus TaxID=2770505 RepID=UPI0013D9CC60|nr:TIGR00730 family Rossman fold protein [Candidatus Laterigemmans baculatus]